MDLATRKMVYYGLLGILVAGSIIAVFRIAPSSTISFLEKDGTINIYMANVQPVTGIQQNSIANNIAPTSSQQLGPAQISGGPNGNLLSLNVTIDSVTIHTNGETDTGGRVITTSFTFDVLKPFTISTVITSAKVPVENVTTVSLHVSKAIAAVAGANGLVNVKVPSDALKIPVSPAVHVAAQMSSTIVLAGTAHIEFTRSDVNQIILTPVLHVERTSGPQ